MTSHSLSRLPTSNSYHIRPENPLSLSSIHTIKPRCLQKSWLGTTRILPQSSNLRTRPFMPKNHRPVIATVTFSLPTAKPERVSSTEKIPKWSSKAIKSFAMGELEARKLKCPNTGTESILMGILIEGTNFAAKFLRANGITLSKVREETVKFFGKADMYFFSPEHPPLTESAQRVLDGVVDEKLKSGQDGEITTSDLLLGVWSEEESPGHKILVALGFTSEKAVELKSICSEPGFVDD